VENYLSRLLADDTSSGSCIGESDLDVRLETRDCPADGSWPTEWLMADDTSSGSCIGESDLDVRLETRDCPATLHFVALLTCSHYILIPSDFSVTS